MPVSSYIEFTNPVPNITKKTLPVFPATVVYPYTMKGIFSDNSLVCYKSGSLSSCGVGTVRNSSHRSKHT